jgi:hypothetical protein
MAPKLFRQVGCALTLAVAAASVPAAAQDSQPRLYPSGHFPKGSIYGETSLPSLVGKTFSSPAYLCGAFICIKQPSDNVYLFSSFDPDSLPSGHIQFRDVLISIRFFNNIPPRLAVGKLIMPNPDDPLTIRRVSRSADGNHLLVQAESWSLPTNQNQQ